MNANCPQCRRESPVHFIVGDLNRNITDEIFDYYRCPVCGVIFLWPIPTDLGKYYPNHYYHIPASLQEFAAVAELQRHKIETVTRFVSRGRLLEIGPSYGSFAYLAKQTGFEVEAIEMDEACCRFMNDVLGVHANHSTDMEAAVRDSGPYNVIALWQVIEHLPDPWSTLDLIVQRLEPGGLLVVATPNPNALQFRILGRLWAHVDAPRHLELIPSRTLVEYVQQLGLNPLLITTTDEESIRCNVFGWETSLSNFSGRRYTRAGLRLIGNTISRILAPIERAEGRGSTYTAVFRKERRA